MIVIIDLLKWRNDASVIWSQVDAVDPCIYLFVAVGERASFGVQAGKLVVSRSLGGERLTELDERRERRDEKETTNSILLKRKKKTKILIQLVMYVIVL